MTDPSPASTPAERPDVTLLGFTDDGEVRVELPPVRVRGWDRIWDTLEEAFGDDD